MNVAQTLQVELSAARNRLHRFALAVQTMRDAQAHREHQGRVLTVGEMCRLEAEVDARVGEILGPAPGTLPGLGGGPAR